MKQMGHGNMLTSLFFYRHTKRMDAKLNQMYLRFLTVIAVCIIVLLIHCNGMASNLDQSKDEEETLILSDLKTIFGHEIGVKINKRSGSEMALNKDATLTLMQIQMNWGNWSPQLREAVEAHILKKPSVVHDIAMERATNLLAKKATRSGHLLPNWVETANFSIEWGNNLKGGNNGIVSDKILKCSMKFSENQCVGVPDIINKWADYFEEAWTTEIIRLGYKEPTGTGSFLYDVYLANTADNIIRNDDDQTPALGNNFLGLTTTYCDSNGCKSTLPDSYSYIVVNNYFSDSDTMKITAAHEFFHAIQFSYPSINLWFLSDNHWWLEATATWMEEVVYDEVNEYYSRVRSWLNVPWISLKYSGNEYSNHEYGDVLFVLFMTDGYLNGDRNFVKYVWENSTGGLKAIDEVLSNSYGKGNFESAFKEFVSLHALTASGYPERGYKEGLQFGKVAVTKRHSNYPVPYSEISGLNAPQELGSNYIHFLPEDNNDNSLTIEFNGSKGNNWAAMVVKIRSDGSGYEHEEMWIDSKGKSGCYTVNGFGTNYSEVFFIPVVLIDPGLYDSASYDYTATLNNVCNVNTGAYLTTAASASDTTNTSPIETNETKKDKRCFIATVAFGSPDSPYVKILRDFRDEYLIPYGVGRRFVGMYYSMSPAVAFFLEKHPPAPFIVRIALFPLIGFVFLLLSTTFSVKIVLCLLTLFLCLKYSRVLTIPILVRIRFFS